MMERDYLSRMSRAARWCLPPAEAAEVLEDYREIAEGRSEEALRRDLGSPWEAARQLAQTRAYRRWVAVFAVLAACVLLPAVLPVLSVLSGMAIFRFQAYGVDWLWWFPGLCDTIAPFRSGFFVTGTALALVWFRRGSGEGRRRTLPKGAVLLLVFLLIGIAFQWLVAWIILAEPAEILEAMTYQIADAMRLTMTLDMFVMGAIGMFALVQARMTDRRWRAVYILALAGCILGLSIYALWSSMDVSFGSAGWQARILLQYVAITALGLVGTGVSLC
ncbi:hypothetical protein C816_03177 [Oscillibacter sp. 1-3]|nr:hypothetical protein C816_03177 [Oscillibacter sp. 1-3]